jgi:hypothetical protein
MLILAIQVVVLVFLCAMLIYVILQLRAQKRENDAQKRETDAQKRAIDARFSRIEESGPVALTDAMLEALRRATFSILDAEGHPVCCGFFVTPCGVALTAAHACVHARPARAGRAFRASTHLGVEFSLEVVSPKVGDLDVAVLRVSGGAAALPPCGHLPLPSTSYSEQQLLGASVALIHGSIAWSAGASVNKIARNNGYIITSTDSLIHYCISTYKGHSGAALLFRGGQVIGLHSEGLNDLDQEHSERSPSTSADAVRLDVPQIWSAVQAAKAAPAAAAVATTIRRRPR